MLCHVQLAHIIRHMRLFESLDVEVLLPVLDLSQMHTCAILAQCLIVAINFTLLICFSHFLLSCIRATFRSASGDTHDAHTHTHARMHAHTSTPKPTPSLRHRTTPCGRQAMVFACCKNASMKVQYTHATITTHTQ